MRAGLIVIPQGVRGMGDLSCARFPLIWLDVHTDALRGVQDLVVDSIVEEDAIFQPSALLPPFRFSGDQNPAETRGQLRGLDLGDEVVHVLLELLEGDEGVNIEHLEDDAAGADKARAF